jgi:hypothetical protein
MTSDGCFLAEAMPVDAEGLAVLVVVVKTLPPPLLCLLGTLEILFFRGWTTKIEQLAYYSKNI